jgi:hypothetical protein
VSIISSPHEGNRSRSGALAEDRFDRVLKRLRLCLGGGIIGASLAGIVAGAAGSDSTPIAALGAALGFLAALPLYRADR